MRRTVLALATVLMAASSARADVVPDPRTVLVQEFPGNLAGIILLSAAAFALACAWAVLGRPSRRRALTAAVFAATTTALVMLLSLATPAGVLLFLPGTLLMLDVPLMVGAMLPVVVGYRWLRKRHHGRLLYAALSVVLVLGLMGMLLRDLRVVLFWPVVGWPFAASAALPALWVELLEARRHAKRNAASAKAKP